MMHLKDYILNAINESHFETVDWDKHGYKYSKAVINALLDGEDLILGDKTKEDVFSANDLSDEQKKSLKDVLDNIYDTTPDDFNKAIKGTGVTWRKIFKGSFSGYTDGLSSKNKGNEFEDIFIERYSTYESEIKKIVPYKDEHPEIIKDGGKNQRRPIKITSKSIVAGSTDFNIGKIVTDVTVDTKDKGKIYLSLKYGPKVTFINAGIGKLLTKKFFNGEEELSEDAKMMFIDMFCLDETRLKETFNSYIAKDKRVRKANKEAVDITDNLKKNDIFINFVKSVIGYGYILVHQLGKDVHFIDMTTEEKLNDLISNLKEAYIEYPKNGEVKRIDITVKYEHLEIMFNIRSKTGGVYPTHIMSDYKLIY